MSKSQSKEFFKKKQRGHNKKNSLVIGSGPSIAGQGKGHHFPASHGGSTALLGGGEDPAVMVINPHPPATSTTPHGKEKRTKICCLL